MRPNSELNPESTTPETDALSTRPSDRIIVMVANRVSFKRCRYEKFRGLNFTVFRKTFTVMSFFEALSTNVILWRSNHERTAAKIVFPMHIAQLKEDT